MHMRPSPKANRCVSNSRSTSPQTAHPHPLALLTNMVQGIETISFPTNAAGMAINRRSPRADRSSTRTSLQRDAASSSSSSAAGNRRFLPVTSAYLRYQTMHTFVVSQPMSAAVLLLLVVAALDGFYESVRVRHPYNFAHGLSPASGLSKLPSSSLRRTATTGANGSELPTPLLAKHSTTATTAANDTASIPTADNAPPTTRVQSAFADTSVSDNPSCLGKEHLVQILIAAGKTPEEAEAQCPTLPLWQEVVDLYGDAPIILGQERCQAYREAVRDQFEDAPALHNIRVDGLFNVGTNALAQNNLLNLERGRYFQPNLSLDDPDYAEKLGVLLFVGWGKHSMIKYKPTNARLQLPVVLVRDPYRWMKSMCKTPYRAVFDQQPNHCPNLVPTEDEQLASGNLTTYKVSVTQNAHSTVTDEFDSLADYWSEWNRMYRDVEFPRLIVRFEDTIFHAEAVMDAIARCAGVERAKPYRYYVEQAKSHGLSSNFVTALAKYGTSQGRFDGMTPADLAYARTHLDPALMNTFGYQYQGRYTAPQVSLAKES